MKIALFTPYLPYPLDSGGKIRSWHLLRALAKRFEVALYTFYDCEPPPASAVKAVEESCVSVTFFSRARDWSKRGLIKSILTPPPLLVKYFLVPAAMEQFHRDLESRHYDLIIADELCMAPYPEISPDLPRIIIRQKVDSVHYREAAKSRPWGFEKALELIEAYRLARYERDKMPPFQACVACSEEDASLIRDSAPHLPCLVIPNGVDLTSFRPASQSKPAAPVLLFVGSMNYLPNIDAVEFFFSTIYEKIRRAVPAVKVQIVGHSPPDSIINLSQLDGVTVIGSVPDVRPYYDQAAVTIVPLRMGGGTRLKIVESMAM
ncbi:MAG TPA: glycosyltransferase, partial [Oligoflexia bacterium]|nr:glycosyltransferase [Oligoflexia bacterium]